MKAKFFEGGAGTGKTWSLIDELKQYLARSPLSDHQRVLALVFMHGARRRLDERLRSIPELRLRFDCSTIDSFAWQIIKRWRSLARSRSINFCATSEFDYDSTCGSASILVALQQVRKWLAITYPIVIVDEMQDCRDGRLNIIQTLAEEVMLIGAADEFQDLSSIEPNPGVAWLRQCGQVVKLPKNHRTKKSGLLDAAYQIREGNKVQSDGNGFKILVARNPDVAASFVAKNVHWSKGAEVVLISPTTPAKSGFVQKILSRLHESFKSKAPNDKEIGPYFFSVETTAEEEAARLVSCTGIDCCETASVDMSSLNFSAKEKGVRALLEWTERERRLSGGNPNNGTTRDHL